MNNLENFGGACRRPILQVIGHAGIDYIIDVENFGDEETSTQIKSIRKYYGGTGMNVALSAAKVGLDVRFFCCKNSDFKFSEDFYNSVETISGFHYEDYGEPEMPTCFIVNNNKGKQKAYIHDETLQHYNKIDFQPVYNGVDGVHLTTTPPKYTIQIAKDTQNNSNSFVSWSPGQNLSLWNEEELKEMLKYTNILFVNETEHRIFFNKIGLDEYKLSRALNNSHDQIVVKTQGKYGVQVYMPKYKDFFACRAVTVNAVDPTGCGDAFTGAFLAKIMQLQTIPNAARFSSSWASYVAEKEGCQTNYPDVYDAEKRMRDCYGC